MDKETIDIRQLEAFAAVMSSGSITSAARVLGRSQPAVTRQIQDLEAGLGFGLFYRNGPRITPTQKGVLFHSEVERLLTGLRHIRARADAIAASELRDLEIAATPTLAAGLVPRAIASLDPALHPHKMHVLTASAESVAQSVLSQSADFGVASLPLDHPGLDVHWIGEAPCVAAFASDDPLASQTIVRLEDLRGRRIITLANPFRLRRRVNEALSAIGLEPRDVIETHASLTALALARERLGVAIVDPCAAYGLPIAGLTIRPLDTVIPYTFCAISPIARPLTPSLVALSAALRQAATELIPGIQLRDVARNESLPTSTQAAEHGRDDDMTIAAAPAAQGGLHCLEARLAEDLSFLELPAKSWVPSRQVDGRPVRDVAIIGGGMAGLTTSGMLKRLGIANHVIYDRAPAGLEGPWITFARMETLRSPKQLTGPAMGLPALTFRAFYEAQFGRAAWEELDKIPRARWMDYLTWYRKVLDLPVENNVEVESIDLREDGLFELTLCRHGERETVLARRVVLATGRDGLGGRFVPPVVGKLDRRFYAHSADDIDFAALRGKRIAVVGASASAMDNAATALEAGAARLDLFIRRTDIPRINKLTGVGNQGLVHGFQGLDDDWKWRFLDYAMTTQSPPPRASTQRVSRHANAHFHLASPIVDVARDGDHIVIVTPKGRYAVDFVIFATGFRVDLAARPELAAFAPHIRLWRDRFAAEGLPANEELATSPDLGENFEFLELTPGACPSLKHLYCFNYPATLSHGKLTGDIPAISEGADRLGRGLARSLFVEDIALHFEALKAFATPELLGDEWTDADADEAQSG